MPELPEVETVTNQLKKVIEGKTVASVEVRKPKSWQGDTAKIIGQKVEKISRRSKIIRLRFMNGSNLLIHLKMSGQLIYVDGEKRLGGGHPTADWIQALPSSHTRVTFTFTDGTHLFFNDQRMFGWIKVTTDDQVIAEFAAFAPDINSAEITGKYLFEKIYHRKVPIKQPIMDNAIVAGVGNIY